MHDLLNKTKTSRVDALFGAQKAKEISESKIIQFEHKNHDMFVDDISLYIYDFKLFFLSQGNVYIYSY